MTIELEILMRRAVDDVMTSAGMDDCREAIDHGMLFSPTSMRIN